MKYLVLIASVLLVAVAPQALAAPFVVSDPYTAPAVVPDYFRVLVDAEAGVNSPAYQVPGMSSYILRYDVGGVPVGSHIVKVQACKAATAWGPEACSAQVNFTFVRPSAQVAPTEPSGIGLVAQ